MDRINANTTHKIIVNQMQDRYFTLIIVALLFSLFQIALVYADEGHHQSMRMLFESASKEYLDGNFEAALERYNEIERQGLYSGSLYYNIGNVYYKLGQTGKAILYWEKALALSGRDEDLDVNLAIARSSLPHKQDELVRLPVLNWLDRLRAKSASVHLPWMAIILSLIAFAGIALNRWFGKRVVRRMGRIVAITALFLWIMVVSLIVINHREIQSNRSGIVTSVEASVYSAPSISSGKLLFMVYEGMKFRLVRELEGWYEISLGTDQQGWVEKSRVGII